MTKWTVAGHGPSSRFTEHVNALLPEQPRVAQEAEWGIGGKWSFFAPLTGTPTPR